MGTQNEIAKVEPVSPLANAAELVKVGGSMDVAKLRELLELQERWEANEAKKAYVVAMSGFKADPPTILKDKAVGYDTKKGGAVGYKHATLYNVTTKINTALSVHGLTASWLTSQDNGSVKVTCRITHILGHSEETSLSAPPDTSGSKNVIQAIASTVTYLERYTLFALTGLAGKDQDDDGNGAGKPPAQVRPPTGEEWKVIAEVCKAIPAPTGKRVDAKKVAAVCYESKQAYPYDMSAVSRVAKWLSGMNRPELFIPENRSQFEIEQDMPGDEDSQPDDPAARDAEATAAEKFGKENDQVPCRFLCNACSHEYDEYIKIGQCPKCLTKDVIDREKTAKPGEVPFGNSEGSQCQNTQG